MPTVTDRPRLLVAALINVWLVGCATMTLLPREVGRPPTAEEQKAIDTFAPRAIAAARQEGLTCATVTFAMLNMPNDGMRAIARPSRIPVSSTSRSIRESCTAIALRSSARAYYPSVPTCSEAWVKVPPRPK